MCRELVVPDSDTLQLHECTENLSASGFDTLQLQKYAGHQQRSLAPDSDIPQLQRYDEDLPGIVPSSRSVLRVTHARFRHTSTTENPSRFSEGYTRQLDRRYTRSWHAMTRGSWREATLDKIPMWVIIQGIGLLRFSNWTLKNQTQFVTD